MLTLIALLFTGNHLSLEADVQTPTVITIEVVDPTIAEKKEQALKEKEDKKLKNIFKNTPTLKDLKAAFKSDMSAFLKEHQPGRLTQEALSARKHAKTAKALRKQGLIYEAACGWLDALDIKEKKKFRKSLKPIVEKAYLLKLEQAEESAQAGEMQAALTHYEHLALYLESIVDHGFDDFPIIDIETALYEIRLTNAQRAYETGHDLIEAGNWEEAKKAYQLVLTYLDPFQDSGEKLARCFLELGYIQLEKTAYSAASDLFLEALKARGVSEEARVMAGETCYQLGNYYFENQRYRAALTHWEKLLAVDKGYRDTFDRAQVARARATRIVSLRMPEQNSNELNPNGGGHLLFQQALTEFIESKFSGFFSLDPFHDHPGLEINLTSLSAVKTGQPRSKNVVLEEHAFHNTNEVATQVTTTNLKYTDHRLTHKLHFFGEITVNENVKQRHQTYRIDQTWLREHHWTVINERKETEDFSPTKSAAIFSMGQVIQDLAGRKKLTVYEVEKLTKASRGTHDLKDMALALAAALGQDLLERFDSEQPLAPPTHLDIVRYQ